MFSVVFNFLINKKMQVISFALFLYAFMCLGRLLCFHCRTLEGFTCAFMKVIVFHIKKPGSINKNCVSVDQHNI